MYTSPAISQLILIPYSSLSLSLSILQRLIVSEPSSAALSGSVRTCELRRRHIRVVLWEGGGAYAAGAGVAVFFSPTLAINISEKGKRDVNYMQGN
ncbi:uncharacterized protein GGS22DRAFT_101474 [Annulohypoxylon maeteangense]|uniref:uncharacterized protein n=1 Tax=Annulohypoxylon maeteangense TaxID=1927788 RepID=UPI0020075C93|nr:uncharacterized protein GGS22DRAFT_101474 [Annulohypoxylon maeteangense]KAI0880012.1 hypothetical protein GGS22DRAFT_101474 [Annulohypoxylon maeteangense]